MQTLKGTKDYLPEEQVIRNYISDTLRKIFEKYGYKPIETSVLDFWEIGSSKYAAGEGSDVLNETYKLTDQGKRKLMLRYELTFKLAKLIGMNPTMRMPFKRYEIGRVYRDGPIKTGRLREFTQCDVDVVGLTTRAVDAELVKMAIEIFQELKLDAYVKVNSRKLLFGIFEWAGIDKKYLSGVAVSIDKIEKYGEKQVRKELKEKGIGDKIIDKLFEILNLLEGKNNAQIIEILNEKLQNENGKQGLEEVSAFMRYVEMYELKNIVLTPTLARGLGYYTGMIWECFLKDGKISSSIAAGGRWDNMIQEFINSERQYPATGISFGLEALYTSVNKQNILNLPKILIISIDEKQMRYCLKVADILRKSGVSCDIAYEKKLMKAINYADKEKIPFIIIIGEEEEKLKKLKLKNMITGEENLLGFEEVARRLQ